MERRREGKARGKFCRGEQARGPTKAYFSSVRPAALPCSVWESRQTSSLMTRLKKKEAHSRADATVRHNGSVLLAAAVGFWLRVA